MFKFANIRKFSISPMVIHGNLWPCATSGDYANGTLPGAQSCEIPGFERWKGSRPLEAVFSTVTYAVETGFMCK